MASESDYARAALQMVGERERALFGELLVESWEDAWQLYREIALDLESRSEAWAMEDEGVGVSRIECLDALEYKASLISRLATTTHFSPIAGSTNSFGSKLRRRWSELGATMAHLYRTLNNWRQAARAARAASWKGRIVSVAGGRKAAPTASFLDRRQLDLIEFRRTLESLGVQLITDPEDLPSGADPHDRYRMRAPTRTQLEHAASCLLTELPLYTTEFCRRAGFRYLVLCRDLERDSLGVGGLAKHDIGLIYLDVGARLNAWTRRAFHHEIFHFVNAAGKAQRSKDRRWGALNVEGFEYRGTGREDSMVQARQREIKPGFISRYAMTNASEDKAEVYANVVVNGRYVAERVRDDAILESKVRTMTDRLSRFCPEMSARLFALFARQLDH